MGDQPTHLSDQTPQQREVGCPSHICVGHDQDVISLWKEIHIMTVTSVYNATNLNIFLLNKNTIGIEHNFHNFDRPLPQIYEEIIHKANIVCFY